MKTEILSKRQYEKELSRLQLELVRLQEWIVREGLKVVVLFEGRDTAGKGGNIRRIAEKTNPRVVRSVALGVPSDRERTQWYFQRYVAQLPRRRGNGPLRSQLVQPRRGRAGDGLLHRRRVRGVHAHLPPFRAHPPGLGHPPRQVWLSVSDEEQERRFKKRLKDPEKRWKLSPIDIEARARWVDYAEAKDEMFACTDTKDRPGSWSRRTTSARRG